MSEDERAVNAFLQQSYGVAAPIRDEMQNHERIRNEQLNPQPIGESKTNNDESVATAIQDTQSTPPRPTQMLSIKRVQVAPAPTSEDTTSAAVGNDS